jgi:plastocyanin
MVLFSIGARGPELYPPPPDLGRAATIRPPGRDEPDRGAMAGRPPDPDRSATQPMPHAAARRLPRLLPLAVTIALLGAWLALLAGGPAAAQTAPRQVTIEGTAANKWEPANATVRPGGTVRFTITGGVTHPVLSGDGSDLQGDDKFDASDCGLQQMAKVGDSCQVKFPTEGSYPYFCQVHVTQGMKGVITVGESAGAATTTTAAGGEVGGAVVEPPSAASPPSAGRPAIYWAGWGLFALGALLALGLIALYVRFSPGFNRPKS